MGKRQSFKFLDKNLNLKLIGLVKEANIDHAIDRDGVIHYSAEDEEVVGNDLICSIRDKTLPSWQVLTCPSDWIERYRDYMSRHNIPFREELSNGELWFLIPRKCRPFSWNLERHTTKQRLELQGSE